MTTEIEVHFRCDRQCRSDWRLTLRGLDEAAAVSVARRSGWRVVYDLREDRVLETLCPACEKEG